MYKFMNVTRARRSILSALSFASVLFVGTAALAQEPAEAPAPTEADAEAAPAPEGEGETADATGEAKPADAAPAPPTKEQQDQAMKAFTAGSEAFEQEKYEEAVTHFTEAYETIPSPHAEYWIAVSLDKADPEDNDPVKIAKAYQTLLNNPGASHIGADKVEEAKKRYLELRKFLPAKITIVSTPAGATVKVDGELKEGVTPIDLEVMEGKHVIELNLEGYQAAIVDAEVSGGVNLEQQVEMTELPPPPPPPAPVVTETPPAEEKKKSIVPAAVTLGLGGAGLIAGTVFGIMALNAKSDFKDDPTVDNADAAERNALIADMSFGVALTLGITGIVLLTSKDDSATKTARSKPRKELLVAPYASPRGAGAAARLTF